MLLSAHFYGLPPLSRRVHSNRQINRGVVIRGTISIAGFSDRVSNAGYPQTVQGNHKVRSIPAKPCPGRTPTRHHPQNSFLGLLFSAHFQKRKNPFPLFSLFQLFRKNIFSANCAVDNNCTFLLLFTAQFKNGRLRPAKSFAVRSSCYPAHIFQVSPHFVPKQGCYPPHIVVLGTNLWLFPAQSACYSVHIWVVIGGTALPYI